eukprot:54681-Chlamydomonas_euryale.AAC.1
MAIGTVVPARSLALICPRSPPPPFSEQGRPPAPLHAHADGAHCMMRSKFRKRAAGGRAGVVTWTEAEGRWMG